MRFFLSNNRLAPVDIHNGLPGDWLSRMTRYTANSEKSWKFHRNFLQTPVPFRDGLHILLLPSREWIGSALCEGSETNFSALASAPAGGRRIIISGKMRIYPSHRSDLAHLVVVVYFRPDQPRLVLKGRWIECGSNFTTFRSSKTW